MEKRDEAAYLRAVPVLSESGNRPTLAQDIKTLFNALASRWKLIAICAVLALSFGLLYVWTTAPTYKATAEILLDPRERKLVDGEIAPSGMGSSSFGADASLVESQSEIIQSRKVLTALIEQENLVPLLGAAESSGNPLSKALKSILYGPNAGSYSSTSTFDRAMNTLASAIKVERVGSTYVLRITVATGEAELSARLANGLAGLYLTEGQDAVNNATREAAEALEARLVELRTASETAQKAVEDYKVAHGLIDAQGVLIDEQQLTALNSEVTRASIATEAARSRLEEVRRLAASPAAGGSILSSTVLEGLRTQLDAARAEEISLSGIYGERHPSLIVARDKRQSAEANFNAELSRIVSRTESDLQTAQDTESSLKVLLKQYEERRSASNNASIELRELERVAKTNQDLYEAFSVRAGQAREQIDLPSTTARIISDAVISSQPAEPRVPLVLAMSLAAGLAGGTALAWLLHLLNGTGETATSRQRQRLNFAWPSWMASRPLARKQRRAARQATAPPPKSATVLSARDEIMAAQKRTTETKQPIPENHGQRRLIAGLFR